MSQYLESCQVLPTPPTSRRSRLKKDKEIMRYVSRSKANTWQQCTETTVTQPCQQTPPKKPLHHNVSTEVLFRETTFPFHLSLLPYLSCPYTTLSLRKQKQFLPWVESSLQNIEHKTTVFAIDSSDALASFAKMALLQISCRQHRSIQKLNLEDNAHKLHFSWSEPLTQVNAPILWQSHCRDLSQSRINIRF